MQFIDSHAHLTGEALFPVFSTLVENAAAAGVSRIVNICTDRTSLERALNVMEQYPSVVHTAAIPPHDVAGEGTDGFAAVKDAAEKGLLYAIGETGLDYYHEGFSKELQQKFLIDHLRLANTCDLPIVIHCRAAFDDFFKINRLLNDHFLLTFNNLS
jgi:TatD DNase family protein